MRELQSLDLFATFRAIPCHGLLCDKGEKSHLCSYKEMCFYYVKEILLKWLMNMANGEGFS